MAQVARMFVNAALARGEDTLLNRTADGVAPAITARDVAEAAHAGDHVARAVIKKVAEKLGDAMAILVDVVNPDCIIVGGLALRFGEQILGPARRRMMRQAIPGSAQSCTVLPAGLGERIGDVAALCVAIDGLAKKENRLPGKAVDSAVLSALPTAGVTS
jgi:glucokinase